MKAKFTKEQLEKSILKYQKSEDVANDLGVNASTVDLYIKKYNLFHLKPRGFYSKYKKPNVDFKIKQSEEAKQKRKGLFSGDKNPFFGKKHTKETKEKMSKNHADFSGDKNPFKKACEKDPELLVELSNRVQNYWADKTEEEKYYVNKHKNCIYEDISKRYWNQIVCNARTRNLEFDLKPKDFWDIWIKQSGHCKLSGIKLNLKCNKEITASLDRIDSNIGYIKSNVQIVHKDINRIKSIYSNEYFIYLCQCVTINNLE